MSLTRPRRRPRAGPARALRGFATPANAALAVLLLAGLALRLEHIRHGLPAVYHADEAYHYTSRAVAMFRDGPDPGYYQNPSGFTYLVHAALRLRFPFDDVLARYTRDPTEVFTTARVLAAILCMVGVGAVYAVGRRLWGAAAGLAAAAILTFAFLPVAYSRLALTDVAVFAPVALALLFLVRALEGGGRRPLVVAGGFIGLAIGFKYTAGLLVVPLVAAAVLRHGPRRAQAIDLALALAATVGAFLITTPYFLLDLHSALYQLKVQQQAAAMPKLGQASDGSVLFYLRSLWWGFGWIPTIAAAAGLVLLARRDRRRALLLGLFPILLFTYIATADRYFARWLMPAYPVLALLAGFALARAATLLSSKHVVRAGALVALLAVALAQPVAADLRTGALLGRTDTRALTRSWLNRTLPPGTGVVVEPATPAGFFGDRLAFGFGPPPKTPGNRAGSPTRFIGTLQPSRIDAYRRAGYCVVVTMSLVRDRALARGEREVAAYYDRLRRESRVLFRASPYRRGAEPVPFDFDQSTHLYEPRAYHRPGPDVTVLRLDRCRDRTARAQ